MGQGSNGLSVMGGTALPGVCVPGPGRWASRGGGTATNDPLAELLRHVVDLFQATGPDAERRLLEVRALLTRQDGPAAVASCERAGQGWRVELAGRAAYVRHSVGMNHLAALVANPHQEIPALELAGGFVPSGHDSEGTQPIIDDLARRRYKQRLSELGAEIDDSEATDNPERAAMARAERDWLLDELATATGLGGRVRRFTGNAERARVAVSKAVRRALDRIAQADPVIGGELRATVETGMRCCYRPTCR
jgi:hypothetical protein